MSLLPWVKLLWNGSINVSLVGVTTNFGGPVKNKTKKHLCLLNV